MIVMILADVVTILMLIVTLIVMLIGAAAASIYSYPAPLLIHVQSTTIFINKR